MIGPCCHSCASDVSHCHCIATASFEIGCEKSSSYTWLAFILPDCACINIGFHTPTMRPNISWLIETIIITINYNIINYITFIASS